MQTDNDDDFPLGAIENGRVFIAVIDREVSMLDNTHEWLELKRCFEYMAAYLMNTRHHQPSPATQTLVEKVQSRLGEPANEYEEGHNHGILDAIADIRHHTDDQSRELDEARQRNADLVEALQFLIAALLKMPPDTKAPGWGYVIAAMHGAHGALVRAQSQPQRPEPATPAGKL